MSGWSRKWTAFTIVLIAAHLLLHVGLGLGAIAPDLLTAAALLGARRLPLALGVAYGFCMGLLGDAFAVDAYAATGLGLAVACGLGALTRDYFEGESLLFTAVYVLVGAALAGMVAAVMAGRTDGSLLGFIAGLILTAVYTGVAGGFALAAYREVAGPRA